jgi:hypothetical protein
VQGKKAKKAHGYISAGPPEKNTKKNTKVFLFSTDEFRRSETSLVHRQKTQKNTLFLSFFDLRVSYGLDETRGKW